MRKVNLRGFFRSRVKPIVSAGVRVNIDQSGANIHAMGIDCFAQRRYRFTLCCSRIDDCFSIREDQSARNQIIAFYDCCILNCQHDVFPLFDCR